jgi:hypothetical protein
MGVLVHGAFVDGSGWQGVYGRLRKSRSSSSVIPMVDALAAPSASRQRLAEYGFRAGR